MKTKLKLHLSLLITAAIIIPAAAIIIIGRITLFSSSSSMMKEEIGFMSSSQSGGITILFDEYSYSLRAFAKSPVVKKTALGQYANIEKEINTQILNSVENNPYILDVIITDSNGVLFADYIGRGTGSIFFGFNETVETLNRNEVFISDIYISGVEFPDDNIFYFAHQIREDDLIIGFVFFIVSVDALSDFMEDTGFFTDGNLFLIDSKGTAINFEGNKITRSNEINGGLQELLSSVKGTKNNSNEKYISFTAGRNIGYYNNISNTPWMWFCIYPSSNIYEMAQGTYLTGLITVIVSVLVFIILMFFIIKMVIKPINLLITYMSIPTESILPVSKTGEFSRMASVFNEIVLDFQLNKEHYQKILQISGEMFFEWDFKKESMFISENLSNTFDVSDKQSTLLNGKFVNSIMEEEYSIKYNQDINQLLKTKIPFKSEYRIFTRENTAIWISLKAACITDNLGNVIKVVGFIYNINNKKLQTAAYLERTSYDFISGFYNRESFINHLQNKLMSQNFSESALLLIDIDDFKEFCDKQGHSTGDEIVKFVSSVIKKTFKNNFFAGRFGDDEFVVCIDERNLIQNISGISEFFLKELNNGCFVKEQNKTFLVKASIGIAFASEQDKDANKLIALADEAMYYVKKNGKNNVHIYSPISGNFIDMLHLI